MTMLLAFAIVCGMIGESFSQQSTEPPPFSATVGYSSSVFCYLDRENTQTAARLWANLMMRRKHGTAESRIFQSQAELERELQAGKLDLVVLLPNEYLGLRNRSLLEPLYVSTRTRGLYDTLLLVTRNDSGITTMRHLKGKNLMHPRGAANAVHRMWLETLTMRQGVREPNRYFSSMKEVITSSQALMPVFFRHADACIISRNSFDIMAELNPQLRTQMRIIEETAPMATGVICIRRSCDQRQRETLKEILDTLDHSVEGKQLLTLFRMSGLIPHRPSYLESSVVFLKKYNDLKNAARQGER
jgi:phosphonate transport system substrate-binding protein